MEKSANNSQSSKSAKNKPVQDESFEDADEEEEVEDLQHVDNKMILYEIMGVAQNAT
jgi:hypothetical protein